jgi:dinuclear metal center YbgI/SA1388 family protein
MKLNKLMEQFDIVAPLALAEDWDNVGLLAGDPNQNIKKVMLTIDMTRAVLDEAKSKKIDCILAYHPPLFEPIKRIVANQGVSPLLYEAIKNKIAIYSTHTALDSAHGGVNDILAGIIGIENPKPIVQPTATTGDLCKIVVYLPKNDLENVSQAMFTAGAGSIGDYSECSFRCEGIGTFKGGVGTQPTIGKRGKKESVTEFRLETITYTKKLNDVLSAMIKAHSYESVAYDLFPILSGQVTTGLGRMGTLPKESTIDTLIDKIKNDLKLNIVGVIGPQKGNPKKGAVCAGSCGSVLNKVIAAQCDFYLTGELKHHFALELQEAGVTTICVSHTNSERMILPKLARQLKPMCKNVIFIVSNKDSDPFTFR